MMPSRSNIRVEVTFKNPVVFAGESLTAIVTFKNVSVDAGGSDTNAKLVAASSPGVGSNGSSSGHQRHLSTIDTRSVPKPRLHRKIGRSADLSNENENVNVNGVVDTVGTAGTVGGPSTPVTPVTPDNADDRSGVISPTHDTDDVQDEDDSSWLSGRRLSMQLANSFREFYNGSNNSSSGISRQGTVKSALSRSTSTVTRGTNNATTVPSRLSGLRPNQARQSRSVSSTNLLMGFAQLQGYFQIDDGIISADVFEHVKTQGIVIGRNGLEYRSKGETGLLKGLTSGLGSFSNFGSLFKSDNANHNNNNVVSNAAENPDIPIFSTPQSLLFVDLKLSPGESKSFCYQLNIPKTLPPSCRGKAISIYYNLVIGTQKLGIRGTPEPKIILVPFRVFPFVDSSGKQPSHNLTEPIVSRTDDAVITQLHERRPSVKSFEQLEQKQRSATQDSLSFKRSKDEFANYLDHLLTNGLPSIPTKLDMNFLPEEEHRSSLQAVGGQEEYTARENIDFFIKYYQQIQTQQNEKAAAAIANPTHKVSFDINLKGHRIAYIYLSRPVYRIGEDIILVFDFSSSVLNCHHITATLETTEKIASKISLKSEQEVASITRRIFSHTSISTFSSSKTCIQFTIPSSGTPQFSTSDISLGWSVKIDFITSSPRLSKDHQSILKAASTSNSSSTFIAKSALPSESFSCRIPIQVYPTNQDIKPLVDHHSGMVNRTYL